MQNIHLFEFNRSISLPSATLSTGSDGVPFPVSRDSNKRGISVVGMCHCVKKDFVSFIM